jgi:CHAT domain-containing protein
LATHGFVDTAFVEFSGLAFSVSKDSTDDGLLMGYEISDLNLPLDLVTLSACETGRGKMIAGEGVLGLPRLFLGAGARTVLMTLWQVDDKFTSELMPKFYDFFLNQRLSKADALAKAKLALLHRGVSENGVHYQHPFYWASFVLYGNPGESRSSFSLAVKLAIIMSTAIILAIVVISLRRGRRSPHVILS